jgi:ATP-dependent Zn protease
MSATTSSANHDLYAEQVIRGKQVSASVTRERQRQRRLARLGIIAAIGLAVFWTAELTGRKIRPGMPDFLERSPELAIMLCFMILIAMLMLIPVMASSRSPHTMLRASDSPIRLADVVGAGPTKREAIDSLNLFLNHEIFTRELGGTPRRGLLFEGPPGTGKTYLAKAMAAEAGVPFMFVAASEFQSHFYGMTSRKVRKFFKTLRKVARAEGGAIGFIDEFDAIGADRGRGGEERVGSTAVNELLVQMQSFDLPTGRQKFVAKFVDGINLLLPPERGLPRPKIGHSNVLVIAATNHAAALDKALLRPGRFDRTIYFDLPSRADRVEIAQYYLSRKSHDVKVTADDIAGLTAGYSPVRIEKLLDEALIVALRNGRRAMTMADITVAQLSAEVGLSHDVGYQADEKRRIAIHESGHALAAVLVGRDVKMASILRRSASLGLVAHTEFDERFLRTPEDATDLITVALAGRAAELHEYGTASSGIAADLAMATTIACQMVGALGAGDSLISLEAAMMPGAGNLVTKVISDEPSRHKVDDILDRAADRAACMMLEHRVALIALADALCMYDELDGHQVTAVLAAACAVRPEP